MTIKKKLILSNILMLFVPALLALIFGGIMFKAYGERYWDALEEMYDNEHGVYSAQNMIYAYKDELGEEARTSLTGTRDAAASLVRELNAMGYHVQIAVDQKTVYSDLEQEDRDCVKDFAGSFDASFAENFTLSKDNYSVIRNTFVSAGNACRITAVYLDGRSSIEGHRSYFKKYVGTIIVIFFLFVLAVIVLTNAILTSWISRMILKPLAILKNGTKEIADGNLECALSYEKEDEFGEVCKEFEQMRVQLKESVNTRLRYEKYRRELMSGISHDLRTPLTSIKGYVEGLKDGIADTSEKRRRYYDAIHIRALDMEALVDSLSTFARLENEQYKYHLEVVNLDEYIRQLLREYEEEARQKNAMVLYDTDAADAEVCLDIQEMHRMFYNLFENSIKYRKRGRTVIHITVHRQEDRVNICVADDGPGVYESDLPHIFESFYRGDESRSMPGKGSGLGLAIVKRIVEGHHGTISACNEKGLVMKIILPLAKRS